MVRESVLIRVTDSVVGLRTITPPIAALAKTKVRVSTTHFRAKVAVTTAVIVLFSEVVSFIPSQLVWPL